MTRLTKLEIERRLLEGKSLSWNDANGKAQYLELGDQKQRRLFAYLRASSVRKPTELPPTFVAGLAAAYDGGDDPGAAAMQGVSHTASGPWRLQLIQTEGFGGLNTWKGSPFKLEADQVSLLLEGPNGSGKSSLAGAIIWALTGERPRDQHDGQPHERQPVFSEANGKQVGTWPPVACYPSKEQDLVVDPLVRVILTFQNSKGEVATVERSLGKGLVSHSIDPKLNLPEILIETGLLMPARLSQLRLANGPSKLTEAIQTLTGLDDLIEIGLLAVGLCHGGREYQTYRSKELAQKKKEIEVALATAKTALEPVMLALPIFSPSDTADAEGTFATFGKQLRERAAAFAELCRAISCPGWT
ncbi:DNA polymerase III delta prime subunit [Inquilinus ginsengisoli]|uniref:ATP-binding protein n=1 Tax=Inquilinus ginsengisoli TaxID=363840 RepID=UPI003D1D6A76